MRKIYKVVKMLFAFVDAILRTFFLLCKYFVKKMLNYF